MGGGRQQTVEGGGGQEESPTASAPRRAIRPARRRSGHPGILLASVLSVFVLPPRSSGACDFMHACRERGKERAPQRVPIASLASPGGGTREGDSGPSQTCVVAHLLPTKKHRILQPLARAFERLGMQVVLQPLQLDGARAHDPPSLPPGSCLVLLSHVKHLLGEEDHNPAARSTLEALERWENANPDAVLLDSLATQRCLTARDELAAALLHACVHGEENATRAERQPRAGGRDHPTTEGRVGRASRWKRRWRLRWPRTLTWLPPELRSLGVGGGGPGADERTRPVEGGGNGSRGAAEREEAEREEVDKEEEELRRRIQQSGLRFPLVCKPLHDDGRQSSHELTLVWRPAALSSRRHQYCILQEFVPHTGVVYKVCACVSVCMREGKGGGGRWGGWMGLVRAGKRGTERQRGRQTEGQRDRQSRVFWLQRGISKTASPRLAP